MSHVDASRYVKGHADLQVVGVDPPWSTFPASLSESVLHGVDPVPATVVSGSSATAGHTPLLRRSFVSSKPLKMKSPSRPRVASLPRRPQKRLPSPLPSPTSALAQLSLLYFTSPPTRLFFFSSNFYQHLLNSHIAINSPLVAQKQLRGERQEPRGEGPGFGSSPHNGRARGDPSGTPPWFQRGGVPKARKESAPGAQGHTRGQKRSLPGDF